MTRWNQKLDDLLAQWAERRGPDDDRLAATILASLAESSHESGARPGETEAGPVPSRAGWGFRLALAAAAVLALGVSLAWWLWTEPARTARDQLIALAAEPAALRPWQSVARGELFVEVGRHFDGQLAWLAESADQVRIGLRTESGGTPTAARPDVPAVAVRLVVLRRDESSPHWSHVWSLDLVAQGEEVVSLPSGLGGCPELTLWTHVLPDGMIAVDADFALGDRAPLRSVQSGVYRSGVPALVCSKHHHGAEYRVFQTAAVLPRRIG